jgi:hypothetical protein
VGVCKSGSLSHPLYLRFLFLPGVSVLHVLEKRSERSPQSFKEWEDV